MVSNVIYSQAVSQEYITIKDVAVQARVDWDVMAEGIENDWINKIVIPAARAEIEGIIRRPVVARKVTYVFDCFTTKLQIFQTEIFGVSGGFYINSDSVETALDSDRFSFTRNQWPNFISSLEVPSDLKSGAGVSVDVTAGVCETVDEVPPEIRLGTLLIAADLYKNRENSSIKPQHATLLGASELVSAFINPHF